MHVARPKLLRDSLVFRSARFRGLHNSGSSHAKHCCQLKPRRKGHALSSAWCQGLSYGGLPSAAVVPSCIDSRLFMLPCFLGISLSVFIAFRRVRSMSARTQKTRFFFKKYLIFVLPTNPQNEGPTVPVAVICYQRCLRSRSLNIGNSGLTEVEGSTVTGQT